MTQPHSASVRVGRAVIARHSRSFALASRLLPREVRDRAVVVYAWCRRADDAVDAPGSSDPAAAVRRLERELDGIYAGALSGDPILDGFASVVRDTKIPRSYPAELLAGMAMDAARHRYDSDDDLRLYCFRAAGVVGLMMSHVLGLADAGALAAAARLGIAMQLTNICRDIREDWDRGRLYIPRTLLADVGGGWIPDHLGRALPASARDPLSRAITRLLERAGEDYRAGDRGVAALPPTCRMAIASAWRIYAAIGDELVQHGCDAFAPRAVVPARRKLALVATAAGATVFSALRPRVYRRDLPELAFEAIA